MDAVRRTICPYVGAKKRWMPQWTPLFAPHTLYCSVFGGAGSDILFKPPSKVEVFNDLDHDLTNLFRVIREESRALIRLVESTPARSRPTYEEALAVLGSAASGSVDRAWAFLVIANQSYRSRHPRLQTASGYAGLRTHSRCIEQWLDLPNTILSVRDRFIGVQQESLDFRKLIPKYDTPDTLFFVDPPYHPEWLSLLRPRDGCSRSR